jgi:hypothetical protein
MKPKNKEVTRNQLENLMAWVDERLRLGDVPRVSDIVEHAHRVLKYDNLKKSEILKAVRLSPTFLMNSRQQRKAKRGNRHRRITVNDNLGFLHADIGFFSVVRGYETPKTFRSGFLVAKDVLSRMIYISILRGSREADNMIWAFRDILKQFEQQNQGAKVKTIGFDKERSVMSHKVQNFFKENNIQFHPFSMSASKSKMAEGAIRLIRTAIKRLQDFPGAKEQRWWHLIQIAVDSLNSQKIMIGKKRLDYAPRDVTPSNVKMFVEQLQKADPSYYFSQFAVDTRWVDDFKFNVGDVVRPKLIVTSAAVLGIKRSEITLEDTAFEIVKQLAYYSAEGTIEKAYLCQNLQDPRDEETFDEDDIALSTASK